MEEYRLLDGKRRKNNPKVGSHRYDRVPLDLYDEVILDDVRDYAQLLPVDLPDEFTARDLADAAHIHIDLARETLLLLYELGIVARIGKSGKAYLYRAFDE